MMLQKPRTTRYRNVQGSFSLMIGDGPLEIRIEYTADVEVYRGTTPPNGPDPDSREVVPTFTRAFLVIHKAELDVPPYLGNAIFITHYDEIADNPLELPE